MTEKQKTIWSPLSISIITATVGGALSIGLYNLWPSFWLSLAFLTFCLVVIAIIHYSFYRTTFLWLRYISEIILGKVDDRISTFKRIQKIRPNDTCPIFVEARVRIRQKNYEGAADLYLQVLSLSGSNLRVLKRLVAVLYKLQWWEELEFFTKEALFLAPANEKLANILVETYIQMGKYKESIETLQHHVDRLKQETSKLEKAQNYNEAIRRLWTIIKLQGKYIETINSKLNKDTDRPTQSTG